MNVLIKYLSFALLGFAIALLLLKGCDSSQSNEVDLKPLQARFIEVGKIIAVHKQKAEAYKFQVDSLKNVKPKLITKYINSKQIVLEKYHTDTLIVDFVNQCDSLNNTNSTIIKKQDSLITELNFVIKNQTDQIQIKQFELIGTNKQLRKYKRRTFFVGLIGAIGIGAGLYFAR